VNDLVEALNRGAQMDVILLDLSKAFDTVPYNRLIHKLGAYGITGDISQWIASFLSNRCQQVSVNGQLSQSTEVISGVPQGSVLGPLLFLCYINDMPENIKSTIRLYADDALLYREIYSPEDSRILQEDLDRLQEWAKCWLMKFNPVKCEYLRVTNKMIRQVSHAKYLGVYIDETLSWNFHVDFICNKANIIRSFLQRNLKQCPSSVRERFYLTLVRPLLEYACVVWSPYRLNNIQKIEKVQRKGARYVYNNFSSYSSVSAMLSRLNWTSLKDRRDNLRLAMMYKIVNNLVEIDSSRILIRSNVLTRGHSNRYKQPFTRINAYKYSFYPDTIKLWNNLPANIIDCTSLQSFNNLINNMHTYLLI